VLHCLAAPDRPTKRRWRLATLFFLLSALPLGIWMAVRPDPEPRTYMNYGVPALICIGLGVGIERAQDWARCLSGVLSVLIVVISLYPTMEMISHSSRPIGGISVLVVLWVLFVPVLWTIVAIYCFLPSTRRHFAEVREARARVRAVPR
jgi:hypothetical protein